MDVSEEPLMDCNFPELLAVDLDRSEDVFLAKHLTAGAPAPSLAGNGNRNSRRYSLQDNSTTPYSPTQPRRTLSRMKSLQAADEKYYSQFAIKRYEEARESIDSDSESSHSSGLEPPSIRTRDVSVTTAATSVTSGRDSSTSIHKSPSPIAQSPGPVPASPGESWMNLDFEEKPTPERRHSLSYVSTPQYLLADVRSMSMGSKTPRAGFHDPFMGSGTPSKTFPTPPKMATPPSAKRLAQPKNFPKRLSSLTYKDQHTALAFSASPRSPPSPSQFIINKTSHHLIPTRPPTASVREEAAATIREEARSESSSERDSKIDDDTRNKTPAKSEEATSLHIASPLANVERWLDSSIDLGLSQHQSNADTMTRIPIPPEVLETLRVSVSCFPETMLLCSSLSIETIRSHARKIRHYRTPKLSSESQTSLLLADGSPKPSRWKWLTSKKTTDQGMLKLQPRQRMNLETPSLTTGDPDWSVIKNIFPTGTDYLCDALYAHVLVYNYITSLCPRQATNSLSLPNTPTTTFPPRPTSKSSDIVSIASSRPNLSDSNKIPRKAASLLGLQEDPSAIPDPELPSPERTSTLRSKASFIMGKKSDTWKPIKPVNSRSTDNYDQSLRDLRLGLAKCIARLVATLRLANSDPNENPSSMAESKEVDPLFIRALCEVVRCSEEQ